MYRNIIFDLDETLIESLVSTDLLFEHVVFNNIPDILPKTFREIFRKILIDEMKQFENIQFMKFGIGTYDLFLHPNMEKYLDQKRVDQTKVKIIEKSLRKLDVSPTDRLIDSMIHDFKQVWLDYYHLIPGTDKILKELYDSNVNLYILTNGFMEIQYAKIQKCGLLKWFDRVVVSEEVGVGKPNTDPFMKLLTEERLDYSKTIMIGDSLRNDYCPAQEIGLSSILFDRSNTYTDKNINKIQSISEIKKWLTSLP